MSPTDKSLASLFIGYLAVTSGGLAVMHSIFDYRYGEPKSFYVLIFVLLPLTLSLITIIHRIYGWAAAGFKATNKPDVLSASCVILLALLILGRGITKSVLPKITALTPEQWSLIALLALSTLLIGFVEEVLFRGLLLNTLLKRMPMVAAIVLSSLLFGLLHTVNLIGGLSIQEVVGQCLFATLFGLVFACFALLLRNITPLILFHAVWDFVILIQYV